MRAGDTLVVASLDRLGQSLQDLISIVADLRRRGSRADPHHVGDLGFAYPGTRANPSGFTYRNCA
ncbi:recombinase family protein [Nocardia rhamnosiphila]|uniref:recombinase family protein n=1 Tax=Nocardia rhamnosiphila TaxID=426716 RepID=UPI0037B0C714